MSTETAGAGPPSLAVSQKRHRMGAVARVLFAICAGVVADASAAAQNLSASDEPPAAVAAPQAVAQPAPVAPAAAGGKTDSGAQGVATSPASADRHAIADKPGRKILVDDTVNDAQLKQILAKGYRAESQARGNEVYYCRSDHELGTRFPSKVCKTARRILQDELQGKNATTIIEHTTGNRAAK